MSLFVTVATDLLVAVLLAATIVTSLRLSKRIGQLKGDEAALRSTIGDLMVATNNAERAIIGLRNALDECDRNRADRIQSARAAVAPRPVEVRSEPQAEAPERPAPVAASEGPNGERLGAAAAAALAMTERALARVRARAA